MQSTALPRARARAFVITLLVAATVALAGCSGLVSRAGAGLSRNLTAGVLDQDDPQTVADGLPAYLLLIDGLLVGSPDDASLLLAAANLYGAYAGGFAVDPARQKRLALKAEAYARRAVCIRDQPLCAVLDRPFPEFEAVVRAEKPAAVAWLHPLAVARAGVLQADTGDWDRIADLPKIELLLDRVRELDADYDHGSAAMYLGVLNCLRPESLGGKPRQGIAYFDEALQRSGGRNQMARVLEAQYCARLLFDQPLHDGLLEAVIAADPRAPGLTLMNTLAQQRARELLESGKDYF